MIIYKVTNKVNNKCYIGQTIKTLDERRYTHRWSNQLLSKAIKKYGDDSFTWEVIDTCDTYDKLIEMECYYIKHYNSFCKEWGYNLTMGGEGSMGRECSDDTRKRISESNRGKKAWNKGLTKDTDSRLKIISENMIGHQYTDKTKLKMSESAKKRCGDDHIKRFLDTMSSKEVCVKRSSTIKERGSFADSNNPRWNTNLDEGRLIELYGTMNVNKLSKVLGVPYTTLSRRIKKLRERGKI